MTKNDLSFKVDIIHALRVDKKGIQLLGRHGDDDVRGWMLNRGCGDDDVRECYVIGDH